MEHHQKLYENSSLCSQLFRDCLSSTCVDWRATSMPLPKPPEPQIAMRKFFIRIEEPLARTMERYAEFLGTDNLIWSAAGGDTSSLKSSRFPHINLSSTLTTLDRFSFGRRMHRVSRRQFSQRNR
jgi:hypothetical protein